MGAASAGVGVTRDFYRDIYWEWIQVERSVRGREIEDWAEGAAPWKLMRSRRKLVLGVIRSRSFRALPFQSPEFDGDNVTYEGAIARANGFLAYLSRLNDVVFGGVTPGELKMARTRRQESPGLARAVSAALSNYVVNNWAYVDELSLDQKQLLLRIAEHIEEDPECILSPVDFDIDFSVVGQKGNATAFLINSLDSVLPQKTENRDATIRDFLKLFGIIVTNQLVRSTRLQLTRSARRGKSGQRT